MYLKELIKDLAKKNNKQILKELENLYKDIQEEYEIKDEKLYFQEKIDLMDKKYDLIVEENKKLKEFVKDKTDDIEELKKVLGKFKIELKDLRNNQENESKSLNKGKNKSSKKIKTVLKDNFNIFKKKNNLSSKINKNLICKKEDNTKILVKNKEESTLSISDKYSTPDKNNKNSSTATNKTHNKGNNNFDEQFGNIFIYIRFFVYV